MMQYVAVCCSVLQCVAVCCSVLQCAAVYCSELQCAAMCCGMPQYAAVRCSVSKRVAVCHTCEIMRFDTYECIKVACMRSCGLFGGYIVLICIYTQGSFADI